MQFVFPPSPPTTVPVAGSDALFPVRRIFCVGRNYRDHAREMGALDQAEGREPPFFFSKPTDALVSGAGEVSVVYPPQTANLHHEVELVVGLKAGGANLTVDAARDAIFGYAAGLDLTRRDMQARAKEKGHPWDMSKGFDQSAVCGPLTVAGDLPGATGVSLEVNGSLRQQGRVDDMIWGIAEVIANLSTLVRLAPGDLIYTGTPAGVAALVRGDTLRARVEGVAELRARIV